MQYKPCIILATPRLKQIKQQKLWYIAHWSEVTFKAEDWFFWESIYNMVY